MALVMDVFRPEGNPKGRGIVDVVSNGWLSDRVQLNAHIGLGIYDVLCRRGYTVFAVSPGSVTKTTGLDMVRHVREAIRHIKAQHEHFQIDPDRLGITGASAGGHLAALAALLPKPARPRSNDPFRSQDTHIRAAGLFFPPTDLLDYDGAPFPLVETEGIPFDRLLFENGVSGRAPEEVERRIIELSPVRRVKEKPPPFLLFHGTADPLVPLSQSKKLADALRAAGGDADLVVKEGGGHPWPGIRAEIEQLADCFDHRL